MYECFRSLERQLSDLINNKNKKRVAKIEPCQRALYFFPYQELGEYQLTKHKIGATIYCATTVQVIGVVMRINFKKVSITRYRETEYRVVEKYLDVRKIHFQDLFKKFLVYRYTLDSILNSAYIVDPFGI